MIARIGVSLLLSMGSHGNILHLNIPCQDSPPPIPSLDPSWRYSLGEKTRSDDSLYVLSIIQKRRVLSRVPAFCLTLKLITSTIVEINFNKLKT